MDDLFLNRMLFEWLRNRWKEQAHVKNRIFKEILKSCQKPIDI